MTRSRITLILCTIVLIMLTTLSPSSGLKVTGAIFRADVSPGDHVSHEVALTTDEDDNPLDLNVSIEGFGQTYDGSSLGLKEDEDKSSYSARPFLKANRSAIHIPPGGTRELLIEGSIPDDIGQGSRYALITLSASPEESRAKGTAMVLAIDIPVILTIRDTEQIDAGEIRELEIAEPVTKGRQNVSLLFENTGNHHYKAVAGAVLKGEGGEILANASAPVSSSSIIPSSMRHFNIALIPEEELGPGTYVVDAMVSLEDGMALDREETTFEVVA